MVCRATILVAILATVLIGHVYGHGAVVFPPPRNNVDSDLPPWKNGVPSPVPFEPWCPYPTPNGKGNLSATNGQAWLAIVCCLLFSPLFPPSLTVGVFMPSIAIINFWCFHGYAVSGFPTDARSDVRSAMAIPVGQSRTSPNSATRWTSVAAGLTPRFAAQLCVR